MGFRGGSPSSVQPQDFHGGSTPPQESRGVPSDLESTASIIANAIKMVTSASSDRPDKVWSEKKRLSRDSGLFKAISFIQDVTEKVRGGNNFSARLRVVDEFGDPLKLFLRSDGMDTSIPEHVSEGEYKEIIGRTLYAFACTKVGGIPSATWSLATMINSSANALVKTRLPQGQDRDKIYEIFQEAEAAYKWVFRWLELGCDEPAP